MIAIAVVGIFSNCIVYIQIITTFKIFQKYFRKNSTTSLILCCILSRYIRNKGSLRYKFKYLSILLNIGIAIAITILSVKNIKTLDEKTNIKEAESDYILRTCIIIHCVVFWAVAIFEITLFAIKVMMVTLLFLFTWPVMLWILIKRRGRL